MYSTLLKAVRILRFATLVAVAAIGAAVLPAGALADLLPAGLAGEHFETYSSDVTFQVTSRTCEPAGESTLSYIATGPATGPYTGRFREEGTVHVGPQTLADSEGNPIGVVWRYEATFTIDSVIPAATVSGSKSLVDFPARDRIGWCLNRPAPPDIGDQFSAQNQPMAYSAVIAIGGASYSTAGSAGSGIYSTINTVSPIYDAGILDSHFYTSSPGPIALDTTPPDASPHVAPAPNAAEWNSGDVTVTWNWSDAGSALDLASGCPSTTTSAGEGAAILVTATCADVAGNTATRNLFVKVDKTDPLVTLSGVRSSYGVDESIALSCASVDPGLEPSGIAVATCPDAVGPAYALGLGAHTLTATATDNAGNLGRASVTFDVVVTPASLCRLTVQFLKQHDAEEHAAGACAVIAQTFTATHGNKKLALVAAYKQIVGDLASSGRLTRAEANVLSGLADGLLAP